MGFYDDNDTSNKELTHEEEASLASDIARREKWLESYGMTSFTSPDDLHVTQGKYGSRTRKDSVHVPIGKTYRSPSKSGIQHIPNMLTG